MHVLGSGYSPSVTHYQGLDPAIVTSFEEAFPEATDDGVREEVAALEALFGAPMPPPAYADIVVRAAATSPFAALRCDEWRGRSRVTA